MRGHALGCKVRAQLCDDRQIQLKSQCNVRLRHAGTGDLADDRHICGDEQRITGLQLERLRAHRHMFAALQHQAHQRLRDGVRQLAGGLQANAGQPRHGRSRNPCRVGLLGNMALERLKQTGVHVLDGTGWQA